MVKINHTSDQERFADCGMELTNTLVEFFKKANLPLDESFGLMLSTYKILIIALYEKKQKQEFDRENFKACQLEILEHVVKAIKELE